MNIQLRIFRVLLLSVCTLIHPIIKAQGLIFSNSKFVKGVQLQIDRSDKYPDSFSLKNFAPIVFEQHNSTCVAHSIAVARTISYAYNNSISNLDQITANAFSPYWIYFRNKESNDINCLKGLNIEKAMNDVIINGIPRMISLEFPLYYPFTNNVLCRNYPTDINEDLKGAKLFKVKAVYRTKSINGIKIALSKGMPVIAAMKLPHNFRYTKSGFWNSKLYTYEQLTISHCLVVVGYNEQNQTLELMNSWGKDWGLDGYIKIHYRDFEDYFLGGYALECSKSQDNNIAKINTTSNYNNFQK